MILWNKNNLQPCYPAHRCGSFDKSIFCWTTSTRT